jgi:translation initiation factor IF-3
MMFRGRQMARIDLGKAVLDRVAGVVADVGKIEFDARLEGRNMTMVLAPKAATSSARPREDAQ